MRVLDRLHCTQSKKVKYNVNNRDRLLSNKFSRIIIMIFHFDWVMWTNFSVVAMLNWNAFKKTFQSSKHMSWNWICYTGGRIAKCIFQPYRLPYRASNWMWTTVLIAIHILNSYHHYYYYWQIRKIANDFICFCCLSLSLFIPFAKVKVIQHDQPVSRLIHHSEHVVKSVCVMLNWSDWFVAFVLWKEKK